MVNYNTCRIHTLSMSDETNKKEIYNVWCHNYDKYVSEKKYVGPREIVKKLQSMILDFKVRENKIQVLDFGCGTGLVGQEIVNQGLDCEVDGIDISLGMVEKAREKNCYRDLWEWNISEEKIDRSYDIIVSCGVFLEGHAPISLLLDLIEQVRREGFVLFTIRKSYLESKTDDFDRYILRHQGIKMLEQTEIPYLNNVECLMVLLYKV